MPEDKPIITKGMSAEEFTDAVAQGFADLKASVSKNATQEEVNAATDKFGEDLTAFKQAHDKEIADLRKDLRKARTSADNNYGVNKEFTRKFNAAAKTNFTDDQMVDYIVAFKNAYCTDEVLAKKDLTDSQREMITKIKSLVTSSSGLVMPSFQEDIEQEIRDQNAFMPYARNIQCGSTMNSVKRNFAGGTTVAWGAADNLTAATAQAAGEPRQRVQEIFVRTLITVQAVDLELGEDMAFDVMEAIGDPVRMDFMLEAEQAMISTGSGSTQPSPLIVAANITTSLPAANADNSDWFGHFQRISTGASGALNAQSAADLETAIDGLQEGYKTRTRLFMNPKTLATYLSLRGSDGHFLLRDIMSREARQVMLWGYPVSICESFPDVAANANAVAVGDLYRGYTVANKRGIVMKTDELSGFPATRYLFSMRIGGAPGDPKALRFLNVASS